MRDVVFTLLILGLLPVCFRRPLIGLLTFSWLAYMRTQDLTWGFARKQRWSFLVAGVTVAGFVTQRHPRLFLPRLRCWAMVALIAWVGAGILHGRIKGPRQAAEYIEFTKIVGVALFTTAIVVRREHLRVLMWVIALSFGFYGVKIGLAGVLSLGRLKVLQGPGGMLDDNNNFALALCMALPMLLQLGLSEQRKALRRGVLATIPLTLLVIFMTHSRGGFLSLVATIGVLVWRSRNRWAGIGIAVAVGAVSLLVIPDAYWQRIASIADYEKDGSAMGRLGAWRTAIAMATDNPVFGVGLNMFQAHYPMYKSGLAHEGRIVAHNAYLEIWAECGTPALLLYLFLIAATYASIWRVRREALRHFRASWILNYCTMFEASLTAFLVGSTFLNRAQFDLFYHFVAIVVVFEALAREELLHGPARPAAAGRRGSIEAVRRPSFRRTPARRGFRAEPLGGGP